MLKFTSLVRILSLLILLTMAINPSIANDTWWHLRTGKEILQQNEIITSDPFSLTRQGEPWIYPGWLSQVLLYRIFAQFSFAGLNIFTGLMIFIAFVLVWSTLEGKEILKAFVLIIAVAASSVYWSARPQIISFALTGMTIFLLERARKGKVKSLWFLPIVMVLWVNVHGGFAIGFIFLVLYLLAEMLDLGIEISGDRRRYRQIWLNHRSTILTSFLVGLVSLAAASINPHGPSILLYPFRTISIQTLQDYIVEWQSPNFHGRETWPFLAMFFLTWISLIFTNEKINAIDVLIPLVTGYMSLTAARNIALFGLATLPILFRHSNSIVSELLARRGSGNDFPEQLRRILNWILLVLFLIVAGLKIARELPDETNQDRIEGQLPLEAFQVIEKNEFPGELLNSYNWGGYVIWKLYPRYLSFVDGRTDLFGDEILEEYFSLWLANPGWESEMEKWGIGIVLVESHAPIAHALRGSGWVTQFESSNAVVLTSPSP